MFFKTQVCVGVACQLLLMVGVGIAQTTGSVHPSGGPETALAEPPPGGCMPIGVTAAGNMVFPFACKDLIARHRGAEQGPTPSESKIPPAANKAAAVSVDQEAINRAEGAKVQPQQIGSDNKPAETPKQTDVGSRLSPGGPSGCTHFRSYDPKSETYRDYGGRRLPCRS